ncbi:transposase [Erwinia sp. 1181_3]
MLPKKEDVMQQRKSLRLKHYDYRQPGYYYLTLCCQQRRPLFGHCLEYRSYLNPYGIIARDYLYALPHHFPGCQIDSSIIMPDHLHCILVIPERYQFSVATLVGSYKSAVTNRVRRIHVGLTVWQRGYWDRVIRDKDELSNVREYMLNNPLRWCLRE